MKYETVIFDLYGTLVEIYSRSKYYNMLAEMASILFVPNEEFTDLWVGTADQRGTGVFRNVEVNIDYICKKMGVSVAADRIKKAAAVRMESVKASLTSDKGGLAVVEQLKSEGYKIALLSNCSPETPVIWEKLPLSRLFDVAVFSCLVRLRKPDPRIFLLAAEKLGVEPGECLYVGDGDDGEMDGAARAGMHPVLIRNPREDPADTLRNEEILSNWNGQVINSLREVLNLVK